MVIIDPSPQAFKQRRGSYFYYNRAAIGLACAQATAMRIDIAPHKRTRKKNPQHIPDPHQFHIPPHAHLPSQSARGGGQSARGGGQSGTRKGKQKRGREGVQDLLRSFITIICGFLCLRRAKR